MTIRKAYKFRLKTKPSNELLMRQFAGANRFVWNKALALQKQRLDKKERCLSYTSMANLLPVWKVEHGFLKDVPSQSIQQTLKNLDRAIKDAFDKTNPKRFPKFKKKFKCADSFRYPQGFKLSGHCVYLPKLGWLNFFKSREIAGKVKNLTVSRKGEHWFMSVQTEIEFTANPHPSGSMAGSMVGADCGVKRFLTLSDGRVYEPLNAFRALQRNLARKVKRSRNWHKQKEIITKLHIKIADARKNYLHHVSNEVSKNHAVVVLEDLRVSNMSRSAKGTPDAPGKNVRQKAGLNKAILDQGWSEFARQLEYKQQWRNGLVLLVNPAYTSQKCSCCGFVSATNRTSQALFVCQECGFTCNADLNAALNLKAAGLAVLACGDAGAVRPLVEAGTILRAVA